MAASGHFGLALPCECFEMCKVLNAGLGSGLLCSTIIAGIMIFGLVADEERAKKMRIKFLSEFNQRYKCLDCAELLKRCENGEDCEQLISEVSVMIQEITEEFCNG